MRKLLRIALLTALSLPLMAQTQYRDAVSAEASLYAHYRHDEAAGASTLVDSKNAYNATVSGTITFGQATLLHNSQAGNAATYDGTSGLATTPNAQFRFERTDSFTIEAVIKPNLARGGSEEEYSILSKIQSSSPFTGYEFAVDWNNTSRTNKAVLRAFLISSFAGSTIQVLGSTDLSNGKAWHVAMTYDGSSTAAGVKLYVNGVAETPLVINDTLTTSIRNDTISALVGARPGPGRWFKGDLDELAVYTSSLPASTILDHANKFWGYTGDPGGQVPVILDTDLAPDVDDVGDLAVLNALERRGEARLVGVIISSINDFSAPAAGAYNTYYGHGARPVGANQGSTPTAGASSVYTSQIRTEFGFPGQTRTSYDSAATAYRKMLAGEADGSVVVVITGFAKPFVDLLQSAGDGISPLSGSQLVSAKVRRVVVVAGIYPSDAGSPEWNLANDPSNYNYLFANCPVEVVSVGIELGNTVFSGPPAGAIPVQNPVKRAYDLWGSSTREAWGQLGVLYAVRGLGTNFYLGGFAGTTTVNSSTGANSWAESPNLKRGYLRKLASDAALQATLNDLLDDPPYARPRRAMLMH